jgi:hypothetical protein
MSMHKKDWLTAALLAAVGVATGGFGLLAAPEAAAAAGGVGAAGAGAGESALGLAGTGAAGGAMTTAAPGIAGAFGPNAGSMGASLLNAADIPAYMEVAPPVTDGLAAYGGGVPDALVTKPFGSAVGSAAPGLLAYDPAAQSGPWSRFQQFANSDKFDRLGKMALQKTMSDGQRPQPQMPAAQPPMPVQQQASMVQQQPTTQAEAIELERRRRAAMAGYLGGF